VYALEGVTNNPMTWIVRGSDSPQGRFIGSALAIR
jgi:hypothetical protein